MNKLAFIRCLRLLILGLFFLYLGADQQVQAQPNISGLGSIQSDTADLAAMQEGLSAWDYPLAGPTALAGAGYCFDSLLRWEHYTDGHVLWAQRSDVIAYELGTVGRQAIMCRGFGPGDRRFTWKELILVIP